MPATPLLRQRLLAEDQDRAQDQGQEKENGELGECGDDQFCGGDQTRRRALFERNRLEEASASPRDKHRQEQVRIPLEVAKATLQGVAPARVTSVDAARTRANVVKARQAIERWAKVTAVDDPAVGLTAGAGFEPRREAGAPYDVRCSPDVRVTEFLGFNSDQETAPTRAKGASDPAAVLLPSHPQIAAALEESAHQLRVCEDRVQKEECKARQLRGQLAQERQHRAEREQQWEALHGRCEQRIRVLEKLRRSEQAEAKEEVRRLDAERRDENELYTLQIVSIWRRAWGVRTLRRCMAAWAQESQASDQGWQLVRTVWRVWAHEAVTNSLRAKMQAQEERLALQNQEYLAAVSNLKNSAQKKLDAALEDQRSELMRKHAKTLSTQQHDLDEQQAVSAARLHSMVTSMHVRYCASLLHAAFGWLRELSARRRQMERTASAHLQVHTHRLCARHVSRSFQHWAHISVAAMRARFYRLATGISVRRDRACRRSLFKAWVRHLHRYRWQVQSVNATMARRWHCMVRKCYSCWHAHMAAQRLQKSTLCKLLRRLSNVALWSSFGSWRDFARVSRRNTAVVKRVLVRLTHQVLSLSWARWKEWCREKRVLAALLRQMLNRSVASAWRAWQAAVASSRLSRIQDNAAAHQASLREDFRSRLQAAEARMEEERRLQTAALTQNFQDRLYNLLH